MVTQEATEEAKKAKEELGIAEAEHQKYMVKVILAIWKEANLEVIEKFKKTTTEYRTEYVNDMRDVWATIKSVVGRCSTLLTGLSCLRMTKNSLLLRRERCVSRPMSKNLGTSLRTSQREAIPRSISLRVWFCPTQEGMSDKVGSKIAQGQG
ncbi:hypothetical protein L484_000556 [Morus notabilis]|uniref:Uncharacterized protein n=1 Tax=Morus notabilis TaxID=981085 RepID=W9QVT5_9ROSA|nr:hypothetical protein L484_000556 [Morus notabilis]